ncbi:MAG TPA: condensation domain-containing protein, partial [Acidobacteriota bacterium]|nr:condensation domain-containing protein [Acidobacteriota bacterium]
MISSSQPLAPSPRFYKTGDRVRWLPDGNVEFLGRLDDQVKVRGHRIELGEIETILQQHPEVQAAAVRVLKTGQPDAFLVAYVTTRSESNIGQAGVETELRAYLKGQVPAFMVPSVFVHLDQMPLTPSGKIDRHRLPAPESVGSQETGERIAPRTATETLVAELFAELLFQPKIGIHHNFFELGGHSLLATRLATRVREAFAIEFPLQQVFSHPTVAELAGAIDLERAQTQVRASAPPLQTVSRNQKLPLSFTQQRLWFLDQLEPGSAAYIMPAALRLTGELNLEALRNAFSELVKRHEILRTTFVTTDGEPALQISELARFTFAIEDASTRSIDLADTQSATIQQFKTEMLQFLWRPFDLAAGPLLRVQIVKLAKTDHLLLISMHHIVSDGWSIGVMLREVAALYRAGVTGQPSSLPALPVQFADYAAWQRDFLNSERLEAELAYWKQKFAAPLPVLSLPTDRPRPEVQTFQGSDETFSLSPELSEKVRALSRQHGSTLFMTLLAAFQTLLLRYSGQEDIVVGSPIANRNHLETEGLIGPLINTLALRTDFSGQPTFIDVLNRVRQTTLEAFAHSEVPFEKIVDAVQPERDMSRTPLFQVMFDFGNQARNRQKGQTLPGLSITPVEFESRIARLDLTLSMVDTGHSLAGNLEFNTDLFDRVTIRRMLGHFQTLLENLVANPEQPVTTVQLMTATELHQILVEWNDTQLEYPKDKCLHQLFEAQAVRAPLATAVVFGDAELTYGELNARADALAGYLCSLGVGPDTLAGICVERSLEMVVGLLGILKAGGAYVPLDPTYPLERLIFMIQDA